MENGKKKPFEHIMMLKIRKDFTFLHHYVWGWRPVRMKLPCFWSETPIIRFELDSHGSSGRGSSCTCATPASLEGRERWTPPERRDTYVGYFHLTCICPSPNIKENWVIHIWELQRPLILLSLLPLLLHSHYPGDRVIFECAQVKFRLLPGKFIFSIGKDASIF